ncbi:lysine-specific demethylase 3B-like isoform X1 [Anguilla rostrata]|uniref:lysine-specific demethylase 3B-like isoform X1 n=1 Tax=Anguilla rostrata TaxID=7938 RepID=UPI0030CE90CC
MGDSLGLVGKRLLLLFGDRQAATETKETQALWNRDWLRGTVRAVSVIGLDSPGVEVFVEFEDCPWRRRSWVHIYGEDVSVVLVESVIVRAARSDSTLPGEGATASPAWPALSYRALVDRVGLGSLVPVESFVDRTIHFLPNGDSLQKFEVENEHSNSFLQDQPSLQAAVRSWHRDAELQEILRRGSSTILGRRVRVYQPEFDQPWALGLVSKHSPLSHIMEVTIDQTTEKQLVDPRVIHVMLAEDVPEEAGQGDSEMKESEGGKGENGRRRRNPSEGDGGVALKRPKGGGRERDSGDTNGNGGGASSNGTNEGMAARVDERVATVATVTAAGGVSTSVSAVAPPPSRVSPNSLSATPLCQSHGDGRTSPPHPPPPHTHTSALPPHTQAPPTNIQAPPPHTPTPPPLKPAPPPPLSHALSPFVGHMPRLTRAASPKPALPSPPEGDEPTAAPVTSSPPSQVCEAGAPSPGTVPTLSSGHNPPPWRGNHTEIPEPPVTAAAWLQTPGGPVFGEARSRTPTQPNGTAAGPDGRPFGFGFGSEGGPGGDAPSSQNLFFQCMATGGQSSAGGCFPAAPQDAAKPTPSSSDARGTGGGLFGIAPPSTPDLREQGKALEPARVGDAGTPKPLPRGTGLGPVAMANPSGAHENLFLQTPKGAEPASPFLMFGESKVPHSAFGGPPNPRPAPAAAPGSVATATGDPRCSAESPQNLFTMSELPKGLLTSPFPGSAPPPTSHPPAPPPETPDAGRGGAGPAKGAGQVDSAVSGFSGGAGVPGPGDAPGAFEASPARTFPLDERGLSLRQQSDSSTNNSDLSDLSEAEDGPPDSQHAPAGGSPRALLLEKSKGVAKGRPRSKPCAVGQSVLKDMVKVRRLKQTGESFLQDGSCINVAPHLHKCRECRLERYHKSREQEPDDDDSTVACRFFHFRRLAFTRKGVLRVEGFLNPQQSDPQAMELWLPSPPAQQGLDLDTSKYILANVGDHFCQLVMSEKEAMMMVEPHQKVAWKRAVRGIREMCDVCETTLFNIHWVCRKCGFGVCLDCYRLRKSRPADVVDEGLEEDVFSWLKCAKGQPHEPQNLMPTQIIPGAALYTIGDMVHSARGKWGIKANCPCASRHTKPLVRPAAHNGLSQQCRVTSSSSGAPGNGVTTPKTEGEAPAARMEAALGGGAEAAAGVQDAGSGQPSATREPRPQGPENASSSALHWLADLATQKAKEDVKDSSSLRSVMSQDSRSPFGLESFSSLSKASSSSSFSCSSSASPKLFNSLLLGSSSSQAKGDGSSLRDLLNSGPGRLPQGPTDSGVPFPSVFSTVSTLGDKAKSSLPNFLDHIIASVVETKKTEVRRGGAESGETGGGVRRDGVMGLSVLDPHTSHTWLCDGRLLCLLDPSNSNNWKIFRECWKQGQPVLVAGVHRKLKACLWRPEAFSQEFGDQDVDLVNCRNCSIVSDVKVRDFWDGFEVISKRLQGIDGLPMALKLKDWPPGEDFRDMMPTRFDDLMENLPLPEYTKRDGRLNLASRLPNFFVRPDLGPKMYNAYGLISTEDRKVGTTNLHLDVSDAVNVMVYVGIPEGEDDHEREVMLTIDEGDVDEVTKRRIYDAKEKPGALWHIYAAKDAEKIRELLRKVGEEQGQENPPDHDPIHDQSWYLDRGLRRRLQGEYGVQGWAIVQFLGDAVFIPAGAPHQVHNLYSCIKVAEDFVSPEHVKHCFRLTQEFRHLSTTHTNHEDKLQVKNIIYHAVKDSIGTLKAHEHKVSR